MTKRLNNDATRRNSGLNENAVTALVRRLAARVDEQDARIAALEESRRKQLLEDWTAPDLIQSTINEQYKTPTRGRKPAIPLNTLLLIRDGLVNLLEDYCPELQLLFGDSKKPENIRTALQVLANPRHGHNSGRAAHLLKHLDKLIDFLASTRYTGNPRQIANAMAGAEKLSWSRSLKRCAAHPCEMEIGERAVRGYVHRKYAQLASLLDAAVDDPSRFALILREVKSHDDMLQDFKTNPQRALHYWRQGVIDMRRLKPWPATVTSRASRKRRI